jgi:hypothetical protein
MMKDVDALSWYYDPLICEYDTNVCSARCQDMKNRPAVYASHSFPEFAVRCPDDLSSAPSFYHASFSEAPVLSSEPYHRSPSPSIHGITNFPVQACFRQPSMSAVYASSTRSVCSTSASCDIVSSSLPAGWLSVGSQRGGLSFAFSTLNPDTLAMPVLFIEHNEEDCKLCSILAPNLPTACMSIVEFVAACSRKLDSPADATVSVSALAAVLQRSRGLNGIDCHCPFVEFSSAFAWLRSMFRVFLNLESTWPLFGCVLFTILVPSVACVGLEFSEELLASVIPFLCSRWQFRCGVSTSSAFGDVVAVPQWFLLGIRYHPGRTHYLSFPPMTPDACPLASILVGSLDDPSSSLFTIQSMPPAHEKLNLAVDPFGYYLPQQVFSAMTVSPLPIHSFVFDPDFPAPMVPFHFLDSATSPVHFCIPFTDELGVHHVRRLSPLEILRSYSFPDELLDEILQSPFSKYVFMGLSSGLPFITGHVF